MSDQQLQPRAPYAISEPRFSVSPQMVTTAFELPGFRVRQNLGVVRGIVVRSRNVFVNIGAVFNAMVGGNITGQTRVLTTATILEVSKGEFASAMAFSLVLLALVYGVNAALTWMQQRNRPL